MTKQSSLASGVEATYVDGTEIIVTETRLGSLWPRCTSSAASPCNRFRSQWKDRRRKARTDARLRRALPAGARRLRRRPELLAAKREIDRMGIGCEPLRPDRTAGSAGRMSEWLACVTCTRQYDASVARHTCECGGLLQVDRLRACANCGDPRSSERRSRSSVC